MNKEISIFDFDSTLVFPPSFASMLDKDAKGIVLIKGKFEDYLNKIKSFFYIIFVKEVYFIANGDIITIYDFKTKKPLSSEYYVFITNFTKEDMYKVGLNAQDLKFILRAVGNASNAIQVEPATDFHSHPETIGSRINPEVVKLYHQAKNKMIVTGRNKNLREVLENKLKEIGIDHPNFGLYLFPGSGSMSIKQYKADVITNSIQENGWTVVEFYEDDINWLNAAKDAVNTKFPEVTFHAHHVA